MTEKIKKIFINLMILFLMIIISLFLAELILRLTTETELINIKPDVDTIYRTRDHISFKTRNGNFTNFVTTNNYGFFDEEWDKNKKSDIRILIVGDSFSGGQTVKFEDHYSRVLERMINNKTNMSVDIMTAGTSSWDTSSEIKIMENELLSFNPDIVILQMYIGNDIRDNQRKGIFSIRNGTLVDNTPLKIPFFKRVLMFGASESYFFKQTADFFAFNPVGKKMTKMLGGSNIPNQDELESEDIFLYSEDENNFYKKAYNLTYELIYKFKNLSEDNDFAPVVLIIPQKEQVYDSKWEEFSKNYINKMSLSRDIPQKRIILNSPENVVTINVLPYFYAEQSKDYYYENDVHTNAKGDKRMAEIIFSELSTEGLLNEK